MRELVEPTVELYEAWRVAQEDWGPGLHEDGFGLRPEDDTATPAGFAAWVARLTQAPALFWWVLEDDAVVSGIALRTETNDFVREHGHIGYGVCPSARGRGVATWALGQVLPIARAQGLDEVLLVCEDDNAASARVIEHCGGYLETTMQLGADRVRRYRIRLPAHR